MVCLLKSLAPASGKSARTKTVPKRLPLPAKSLLPPHHWKLRSNSLPCTSSFSLLNLLTSNRAIYVCLRRLKSISFRFSISALLSGRSLEPGNSPGPTPKTSSVAGLLFCWRARFGRANPNLSTYKLGNNRSYLRVRRLRGMKRQRTLLSALA